MTFDGIADLPAADPVDYAERAVLGAVALDPSAFFRADLESEEFGEFRHRVVWDACRELAKRGITLGAVTISDEIHRAGNLMALGGQSAFVDWLNACERSGDVEYYAGIVRRAAWKRRQQVVLSQALNEAKRYGADPEDVEKLIFGEIALTQKHRGRGPRSMADLSASVVKQIYADLQARDEGKAIEAAKLSTGLDDLDFKLGGGLGIPATHVIAGRMSDGKTALMMDLADAFVVAGWPTFVLSLEDTQEALAMRRLAARAHVSLQGINLRELGSRGLAQIAAASDELQRHGKLIVDDARRMSMGRVVGVMRRWKQILDPDNRGMAFFLDYIQRVVVRERGDRRGEHELIADAIKLFDDACAELRICGVVGWQMNRDGVKDNDRPRLHHLGGSDSGAQVAKTVLAPHHDREDGSEEIKASRIWILKQKDGQRDVAVPVTFDAVSTTFRAAAKPWQQGGNA